MLPRPHHETTQPSNTSAAAHEGDHVGRFLQLWTRPLRQKLDRATIPYDVWVDVLACMTIIFFEASTTQYLLSVHKVGLLTFVFWESAMHIKSHDDSINGAGGWLPDHVICFVQASVRS